MDPGFRVVPTKDTFIRWGVEIGAFVVKVGVVADDKEPVGAAGRDPEPFVAGTGEEASVPAAECG